VVNDYINNFASNHLKISFHSEDFITRMKVTKSLFWPFLFDLQYRCAVLLTVVAWPTWIVSCWDCYLLVGIIVLALSPSYLVPVPRRNISHFVSKK
jgi:hypothetical protein